MLREDTSYSVSEYAGLLVLDDLEILTNHVLNGTHQPGTETANSSYSSDDRGVTSNIFDNMSVMAGKKRRVVLNARGDKTNSSRSSKGKEKSPADSSATVERREETNGRGRGSTGTATDLDSVLNELCALEKMAQPHSSRV